MPNDGPNAQAPPPGDSGFNAVEFLRRLGPTGVLGVAWGVLPAVCGILLLKELGDISEYLRTDPQRGVIAYVAVFIVSAGIGLLPTYSQAILGGWTFGVATGLPAALAGFTGASLVGYLIARSVAKHRVEAMIESNPKSRAARHALIGSGFWRTLVIVTLLRVPPNSPFAITNLVLASSGVRVLPYVLGTAIGLAPRTALAVAAAAAAGSQAKDIQTFIKEGPGLWVFVGGVVVLVLAFGAIGLIANKAIERATKVVAAPGAIPAQTETVARSTQ